MNKDRKVRQKNGKFDIRKVGAAVVAAMLVVAMVVGLVPNETAQVLAAEKLSDLSTVTKYKESLGATNSTEYAGRIWTDKTVYAGDASFEVYGTTEPVTVKNDSDFLVSFSALATSQSISGQTQAPLDVVFVIDLSASMRNSDSAMDGDSLGRSRMYHTVVALNTAMETLMQNPNTRVAVVGFNRTATTLLPLDHYSKNGNTDYFSLSNNYPTDNNVTLRTNAVGSNGTITDADYVQNGTNIQGGLYHGMQLLANADSKATIDGKSITRTPSVILLSDGSPTWAMSRNSDGWWSPESYGLGTGNSAYAGVGMLAMMTGAYMKNVIDANYGLTEAARKTTLYTIGMGIDGLVEYDYGWGGSVTADTSQRDLARVTLNPKQYLDSSATGYDNANEYAKDIQEYWTEYTKEDNERVDIQVSEGDFWDDGTYTLTHPSSGDISGNALINYVDQYYSADDANSVTNVFNDIVNDIAISTPEIPTEHDANSPMTSGYITYTDPIGEYMEVKDFKSIIYGGHEYTAHTSSTNEDETVTTYVFTDKAEGNAVYGSEELNHIIIEVSTTTDAKGIKSQVLTIKIPASLIPLRVNTVTLNSDKTVKSHTDNGAYPIRVLYTVGLQDAVKAEGNVKLDALSDAYLAKHLNEDGTVDFYSNLYTGTNVVNGRTAGNATVVFDAASTNPFYYMQANAYLYTDDTFTTLVTTDALDPTANYYYPETHYEGTTVVTEAVKRTGAQLTGNTIVVREVDENNRVTGWYRPAGTVRVNRMLEFEGTKTLNSTGTAEDFYAPTYNGTTGHFTVYLGNNGKMSFEATGSLEISKTVTASAGLTAPDASFNFTVDLKDASGADLTGEYAYTIVDAEGNGVYEGTVKDNGTITLKAGHTAKIIHLPPNAQYTITESDVAGFTAEAKEKSGTISAGAASTADFINNYSVTPVVFSGELGLTGTKVLEGRQWAEGDKFTFFLTPYNNAPLPEGYDSAVGVTVTSATANVATFDLGEDEDNDGEWGITYTAPGVYRYTVYEKEPENDAYLPGMSYSRALYRIVVTVADNGDGTLTATPNIQKLYEDDATPLFTYDADNNIVMNSGQEAQDEIVFTNTYSAESVTRTPVALKAYTDNSGQNPLVSGMFKFKLTPLGIVENGELVGNTAASNPMPLDEQGNKLTSMITENEGHNVTFPAVTFTENDIPDGQDTITYRYQMEEVIPDEANASNNFTVDGMKYDSKKVVVDVTVSRDASSHILNVNAVYPNNERITTFTNEYTPAPTSIKIVGEKTLTGRDMLENETFEFNIVGANAATNLATQNGTITVPNTSEASVSGGKDGVAVPFNFGEYAFNKPGTFTFNITETKGNAGGVTYDEHTCTVTVVITDNNGKLEAAVTYSDDAAAGNDGKAIFNNTYTATFDDTTAISLYGTKQLTGRPIINGEFYFDVRPLNGAPVALADDIYVPAAGDDKAENGVYEGAITFLDNVTYDSAGEYVYEIYEVIPTNTHGVTYDTSKYVVTVKVTDNLEGKLQAAITKIEKGTDIIYDASTTPATGSLDGIVFANKYEPADVEYAVNSIHKVLAGSREKPLAKGEFKFERKVIEANPTDGIELYDANGKLVTGQDIVVNNADGTVPFGIIKFTKVGTYKVQISEVVPTGAVKDGVHYDTHIVTATFVVTDDLEGNLVATRTNLEGGPIFTNIYVPEGTLVGTEKLNVTKILDLDDRTPNTWGEDDDFTFVLEAGDDATRTAVTNGTVVLPETTNIVINSASAAGTDENANDKVYVKTEAFGDITFYAEGTYTFIIRELAGTEPGMDYDATARTITVTVTDDEGKGELVVAVEDGSQINPSFTNVYNPKDVILTGHDNLHVNKVFTGRPNNEWLATDSFTFTLSPADEVTKQAITNKNIVMATKELVVNKDNKDHAHFGNITFTAAGTYQFIISEVLPTGADANNNYTVNGVKYDTSSKIVEVAVTEEVGEDGTYLIATINDEESDADANKAFTFTNIYDTTSVSYEKVGVTKKIAGRHWAAGDEFTFTMEAWNDAAKDGLANNTVEFVNDANKMEVTLSYVKGTETSMSKDFPAITFHEPGIYEFVVSEDTTDVDESKMTYDKHTEIYTIEVVDNGDGTLSVKSAGSADDMTWENTHIPTPAEVTLTGTKTINGREMTANDRYYFSIVAANSLAESAMPESTLVQNNEPVDNKGTISFGPIAFSQAGTYEYYINERTVNEAGITSDTGYVRATVVVSYNNETGALSVDKTTYRKVNSNGSYKDYGNDENFEFINNYSATGVLDGSLHLNVTKNFSGRENDAWLLGDEFKFTLTIDEGHEDTVDAYNNGNGSITLPGNASGITIGYSDVHKQKAFGDITFTKAGDYQFIVTEIVPSESERKGITYDANPSRTIIVNVQDNGDGTLTTTVAQNSAPLAFTNVYDTDETKLSGATNLVVEKKINGREWITADTYTFTLAADLTHTPTKQAIEATEPTIVMPESKEITITDETKDYKAAFGDITFKETGTYRFVITEKVPEAADRIPGISYATHNRTVTVNVVDNNDGTMTASLVPEYSESLVFVNTYTATLAVATLEGEKKMDGRELIDSDDFQFTISVADGSAENTPLPVETTVTNANDGTIKFPSITYNTVGVYKYTIKETGGSAPSVTNATNEVTATVTVTDNKLGQLVAVVEYSEGGFVFTNKYVAAPTHATVQGTKVVTPTEGNSYNMKGNEFAFEIEPSQANPSSDPVEQEQRFVYNTENGVITFINNAEYKVAGKYEYTVHEIGSGQAGMSYDESIYTIIVNVVDNGQTGELEAATTIMKGNNEVDEEAFVFDNTYNPKATTAIIHGHKLLESEHKDELEAGLFQFELKPIGNNAADAPMPEDGKTDRVATATNEATGLFQFGAITYTSVGEYSYQISEVEGNADGYLYNLNEKTYEIKVKVEDEGGALKATIDKLVDSQGNPYIVFTNGYVPEEVTLEGETALSGKKKLEGRDLLEGEFTFQLFDEAGNHISGHDTTNDADGNFKIEPLTFKKAGTYYYTIKEQQGTLGGVKYDETAHLVKIEVTDAGGHLTAAVTYPDSKDGTVVFNNEYEAADTSITIGATKKLSGRELRANEFTFILMDKDGKELQRVKNAADGTVSFAPIKYTEEGTHVYKVAEAKGDAGYITYDDTVYEITVKVTDNKKGNLVAEMTVKDNAEKESEQLVFNNVYTSEDVEVTLYGTKTLKGRDLKDKEFTFVLKNAEGKIVDTAKNNTEGKFTFKELVFTQTGTFKYTVEEDSSMSAKGIIYDKAKYDITINVTDNGEGKLVAEVIGMEKLVFNNVYDNPDSVVTGDVTTIIPTMIMFVVSAGYILVSLAKARRR